MSASKLFISLLIIFASSLALGSGSQMHVRVWVQATCNIVTPGDVVLDFGALSNGNRSVNANVPINCIKGTQFSVVLNQGLHFANGSRRMAQQGGAARLPYTLLAAPASGLSNGSEFNVKLTASVRESDYQSLPLGQYQDTVVMQVNP
jgi:spore coat protein U-like protein